MLKLSFNTGINCIFNILKLKTIILNGHIISNFYCANIFDYINATLMSIRNFQNIEKNLTEPKLLKSSVFNIDNTN